MEIREIKIVYLWLKHKSYGVTEVLNIELSYRYWCRPKSYLIDPVTPEELITKERHNCCWTLPGIIQMHIGSVILHVVKENSYNFTTGHLW